jgi:hypothetical protein
MRALSSNNEIKKAVKSENTHPNGKGCWVFDRGADNMILKNFFVSETDQCIIRLKRSTKFSYKDQDVKVSLLVQRVKFVSSHKVAKIKKNRPVIRIDNLAAVRVMYRAKGKQYPIWLVISRNTSHGGLCYLLVKSNLTAPTEVTKWAFKGYRLRWKKEEYHRYVKQEYKLKDMQMKTFMGVQSILAVLAVAMCMIYKKKKSLHIELLLDAGYNYQNKHTVSELTNFIYYKISKVVSNLLMPVLMRWKIQNTEPIMDNGQLDLMFN